MNTRILLALLSGLALGLAFVIVGCSGNDSSRPRGKSTTDTIIDEFVENTFETAEPGSPELAATDAASDMSEMAGNAAISPAIDGPGVFDMIVKDGLVYAIIERGLLVHNLTDGKNRVIELDEPVKAIADLGSKILIATTGLFTFDGEMLSAEDYNLNLNGSITSLHQHGIDLYIGTSEGFYQLSINGVRELARDIHVTALASDVHGGIWVGTGGDGLYRWDGERFRKRFLKRDTALFDNVTALAYNHEHLYLGTDRGFFVFDGGSWQPYDLASGLPSEAITSINADEWVIRIGTANGPVEFFNNEFTPVQQLAGVAVTGIAKHNGRIIAASSNAGLLMSSGGLVTGLYQESDDQEPLALEEAPN